MKVSFALEQHRPGPEGGKPNQLPGDWPAVTALHVKIVMPPDPRGHSDVVHRLAAEEDARRFPQEFAEFERSQIPPAPALASPPLTAVEPPPPPPLLEP